MQVKGGRMRDTAHLGAFWTRISGCVESRMRVGVRGDLLNPVVRKWMRQTCFLFLPCPLLPQAWVCGPCLR